MENQQPEALALASILEIRVKMFGEQQDNPPAWRAAKELRRLHARVEELEAMLDSVGAGGVSAQRVTQAKDHIAQDRKMVAAPAMLEALKWYENQAKEMGKAAIHSDSKRILELMQEIAVDYGKLAGAAIAKATGAHHD